MRCTLALIVVLTACLGSGDNSPTGPDSSPGSTPPAAELIALIDLESLDSRDELLQHPSVDEVQQQDGGRIDLVTGLTGTPWGGTKAIAREFRSGTSNGLGIRLRIPPEARGGEIWFETYINFGQHVGGRGDKVIFAQNAQFNRWDVMQQTGGSGRVVALGNGGEFGNWTWDGRFEGVFQRLCQNRWYRLRFHLNKRGNGPRYEAWIDDQKVASASTGRDSSDEFVYIQLGANSAAQPGSVQLFGNPRVTNQDPGW